VGSGWGGVGLGGVTGVEGWEGGSEGGRERERGNEVGRETEATHATRDTLWFRVQGVGSHYIYIYIHNYILYYIYQ
jgi:hypothetical protein